MVKQAKPEVYLTRRNNNRHKTYGSENKVYLDKGTEFQIEINNRTNKKYLAKFKFNGEWISQSGLIVKPGQHIYLDRYLDEPKRFKFDSYMIPESNKDVVSDNGLVEVYFYDEESKCNPCIWKNPGWTWVYNDSDGYYRHDFDDNSGNPLGDITTSDDRPDFYAGTTQTINYSNVQMESENDGRQMLYDANVDFGGKSISAESQVETGRVEKGGQSDQEFKYEDGDFKSIYTHLFSFKLLPKSRKPSDFARYCTNCGKKQKKKWQFCPKCGNET